MERDRVGTGASIVDGDQLSIWLDGTARGHDVRVVGDLTEDVELLDRNANDIRSTRVNLSQFVAVCRLQKCT